MDEFKRANIVLATELDLNAKHVFHSKERRKDKQIVNRYARRKLREQDRKEAQPHE